MSCVGMIIFLVCSNMNQKNMTPNNNIQWINLSYNQEVPLLTPFLSTIEFWNISRVFLLGQLWIINHSVKSSSNNLSNENINTGVSGVFKTKRKLECQNQLFLKFHFFGNTSFHVFITEIIWRTFRVIIDDPLLI